MLEKNKKLFLIFLTAFFLFSGYFCLAAPSENLENQYPVLPGMTGQEVPTSTQTSLPAAVRYFFHFVVFAAGLIIFLAFIKGGVDYLRSAGNTAKTQLAKEEMTSSVIGVAIILCSWLLLSTINPTILFYGGKVQTTQISTITPNADEDPAKREFFQIPIGRLIERAILEDGAVANIDTANQNLEEVKNKAENLKNLAAELKDIALSFECGDSSCSGSCNGSGCGDNYDQAAIDSKVQEINDAIDELKAARKDDVRPNRWDINNPRYDLRLAAALITGACPSGAINQTDFVGIENSIKKEDLSIKTFPGWPDNKIQYGGAIIDDPATFYCENPDFSTATEIVDTTDEIIENLPSDELPAPSSGSAPQVPSAPATGNGTYSLPSYPFLSQLDLAHANWRGIACGPTSIATILRFYGVKVNGQDAGGDNLITDMKTHGNTIWSDSPRVGMDLGAARPYVRNTFGLNYSQLSNISQIKTEVVDNHHPVIILCKGFTGIYAHFMVVYGAEYSGSTLVKAYIMDPLKYKISELTGSQVSSKCGSYTSFWP
ncbi:MAG: C39 family peptidase [Candidatus Paceibacterota bacterium]|jgi:hypothetical protein